MTLLFVLFLNKFSVYTKIFHGHLRIILRTQLNLSSVESKSIFKIKKWIGRQNEFQCGLKLMKQN